MAKQPEESDTKPHFDISAYVVRQLGDELISDEVTALMELVKNSYDADADFVNVVIDTEGVYSDHELKYKSHKGYILIEDNGDGMTRDEIVSGWLTISISKKRAMKLNGVTTQKGRTPLGEKGLGRLSTQRLANKIEIITNHDEEPSAYHVYFNWNDFTEETLLSKVDVEIKPVEKKLIPKGTKLILLDVKDKPAWINENAIRIKSKLSQLIYPKKRKRPFSIYLTINKNKVELDFISEKVKEVAVSRYSFDFKEDKLTILGSIKLNKLKGTDRENYISLIESDNGKGFYKFISNPENKKNYISNLKYVGDRGIFIDFKRIISTDDIKLITVKDKKGKDVILNPGNFNGEIDEYNFAKDTTDISAIEEIFKNDFSLFTKYIQEQAGIRVFRDGFGIRPFGLDGEDWLKLGGGQTSGSSYYGIRPGNVTGFIEIGADTNPDLHEKTDREGIIDNAYYKNFYAINKRVIEEINSLLESVRRAYNEFRKQFGIDKTGLKHQSDVFNLMKKTGEEAQNLLSHVKELGEGITRTYNEVKNEVRKIKNEPLFASSEDNRLQPLLKNVEEELNKAQALILKLNSLLNDASKLNTAVHFLEPQMKTLQDQLSEFSELAGLGIIAESLSHEIDNILDNLIQKSKTHSKYLKDSKLKDSNLYVFVEYVNNSIASLRKQASHLSPLLRYVREEKSEIQITTFAKELNDFYKDKLEKNGISIEIIKEGKDFSININKGKLTQIFDNIILNSEYWLSEIIKRKKLIPKITIAISEPFVKIFDNGLGVDPEIEERIFQPFVTSKPRKNGRGLGLFIVQQLLEVSGCDIVLLPEKNKLGRRYIFQINFSNALK